MAALNSHDPPSSAEALLQRGVAAHRAGDLGRARAIYEEVAGLAPGNADAHHLLGLLLLQGRDFAGAVEALRRAVAIAPGTGRFYLSLGKALYAEAQANPPVERLADRGMAAAVGALREAVARDGGLVEGYVLLGGALAGLGRHEEAVGAMAGAVRLRPNDAEILSHYAAVLIGAGRYEEAVGAAKGALGMRAGHVGALVNLGSALRQVGRLEEAAAAYREALQEEGDHFAVWLGLGVVLRAQKKTAEAVEAFGRAAVLAPARMEPHLEAGETLAEAGRQAEAMVALQQAVERAPQAAEGYLALGAALHQLNRTNEALVALRRAAVLRPELPEVHYDLGIVEAAVNGPYAGIAHYQKAIELCADYAAAHVNLAEALRMSGQIAEALPHARRAVELQRGNSLVHSALLYALHFSEETTAEALLAEHRHWAQRHVEPLGPGAGHDNMPEPRRRLRVGYVSPDFRDHPVGRYLLPVLEHHEREAFEVYLYSSVSRPDVFTARCRAAADHFREAAMLSDEALAGMIRDDRIDVLVDLSLHMAGNRMMTFARRPAPVQISGFGYPSTTGSPAIDVRISDRYLDPLEAALAGPEMVARLPDSFWCFSPHDDEALPRSTERLPPVFANGYVTFGSLNNPAKTTAAAIGQWAAVLRAVPGSRMVLGSGVPGDGAVRAGFVAEGIEAGRIDFVPKAARGDYLEFYRRIDIGIDPFPYTGHSTSCDAFWMGVPVLTMTGGASALPVSRAGESLLQALGLPELVARTREGLVKNAVELAGDLGRLRELAYGMRERMMQSPLMGAAAYTRALEAIYREAWVRWCARAK